MKASEWAFDRIKEAFENVAPDDAEKMSIVQEIMLRSTDNLRRIIAPAGGQGGVTTSYLCPHCNSFPLEDYVAPDCICPEVKSRPPEGSRRGQLYIAAEGKKIANEGEEDITRVTGSNKVVQTIWQTVDTTTPLSSVRQICLQGNRLLFGAQALVIYNIENSFAGGSPVRNPASKSFKFTDAGRI